MILGHYLISDKGQGAISPGILSMKDKQVEAQYGGWDGGGI